MNDFLQNMVFAKLSKTSQVSSRVFLRLQRVEKVSNLPFAIPEMMTPSIGSSN